MKKLKILFLCIALITAVPTVTMTGCRVALVPAKNAAILIDVQELLASTNSLYDRIIISNDKRFATYEGDYKDLVGQVDLLIQKDNGRKKSGTFISQDRKIKAQLEEYQKFHSDKGILQNAEAKVFKAYIKSFIRPRLISELSL